jgi:uncharacterized protein (DUF952 family)
MAPVNGRCGSRYGVGAASEVEETCRVDMIYYPIAREQWDQVKRLDRIVALPGEGEDFVHCSGERQARYVRTTYFPADQDIVALTIDPTRLSSESRYELGSEGESERFPHVYGPIYVSEVSEVNTIGVRSPNPHIPHMNPSLLGHWSWRIVKRGR